jgi:hypothetical protein
MIPIGTLCVVVASDPPGDRFIGNFGTVKVYGNCGGSHRHASGWWQQCRAVCGLSLGGGDWICIGSWPCIKPISPPPQDVQTQRDRELAI